MGARSSQALDPYRILEDLGEVPFGRAVRAVDTQAETPVIVKWVDPSRIPSGEREALVAEARALTRLVQPGLPVVYEVREAGDELRIVVGPPAEGEVGPDLGSLDRRGLIDCGTRLLMLLAEAHASGVLHRHLGPESVGVSPAGDLTLRGFGLTRLVDDPAWEPAPEVRRGEAPSIASDLHAIGHLLAGWGHAVEPPLLGSQAEDPVTAVLARATAEDPGDRYEDAAEMARALTRAGELTVRRQGRALDPEDTQALAPQGAAAPVPARVPARVSEPSASRARGWTLAAVVAVLVVAVGLVAGGFWSRSSHEPAEEPAAAETAGPPPPAIGPLDPAAESEAGLAQTADESPAARLERARVLVESGRTREAEPLLEELLASGELPNPVPVLDLLGTLRLQAGRAAEAAELLDRAVALQPDADLHYKLGLALAAVGRPEAALEQLRAARELDPESPEIREALRHLAPGAE